MNEKKEIKVSRGTVPPVATDKHACSTRRYGNTPGVRTAILLYTVKYI